LKTILISGCCGFIGSNLCDFYLKKDFKVIGLDNLLTGDISNINDSLKKSNFKFVRHDICNEIIINEKIDYILHFASTASPADYLKYPIKTLRIGSLGTENMLKLAVKNKATILVASTSEVYGDPLEHPQSENYFGNVNSVGPRGVYDEAKRYLEALTTAYKKKKKLDVRIIRIFNTYGPKMRKNDGRAIPNFINQAITNKDFTVYGDGNQTRSFCYIDDTIEGINKLLFSNYDLPINIGNPKEYNINQLVLKIKDIIKCKGKITYSELPENDPMVRKPNIDLAKKILKWNPKINLDKGLKKTIDYFYNLDL
tara:strand:- start:4819 stop:5754 length:936 start_codon:yes stop_codon:yes gene_type:complete